MNIYLIEQHVNNEYDTYDRAVVVASNEEEARRISPSTCKSSWTNSENVKVTLLGVANAITGEHSRVICASFNAG